MDNHISEDLINQILKNSIEDNPILEDNPIQSGSVARCFSIFFISLIKPNLAPDKPAEIFEFFL